MSFKYSSSHSKYCYPDSDILINNFDIKDPMLLQEAEELFTTQRLYELIIEPIEGTINFDYLKRIHCYIFQDIYPFAGKVREEDISKDSFRFASWIHIDQCAEKLFEELANESFDFCSSKEQFALRSAYYMAELNVLHPFREGNGRAIREFIRILAERCNFRLSWNAIEHNEILLASIKSVHDIADLTKCIKKAIE